MTASQEGTPMFPGFLEVAHDEETCRGLEIRDVMARIGDKWSLCVVGALYGGPMRFNQIKRRIAGISQRMLTLTLRSLERDGLVERTVYPTNPPSVEYALTPMGQTLLGPVLALAQWTQHHLPEIQQARHHFDSGASEGTSLVSEQTR
jgi:DNA-binding HxlR family transcriptional regulator